MKIWNSYGSEHSANLVMIGRFKDAASAEEAKEAIDKITAFMNSSDEEYRGVDRYPDGIMEILKKIKLYTIAPGELEQFTLEFHIRVKDNQLIISTDELDVSALLKLMIDKGARVEVYSRDDYPDMNKKETT